MVNVIRTVEDEKDFAEMCRLALEKSYGTQNSNAKMPGQKATKILIERNSNVKK